MSAIRKSRRLKSTIPRKEWQPKRKFKMRQVNIPRVPRAAVPSTLTVLNMLCGYASIVMASQENFSYAGWFIILSAFFDTLDGFVARLTNSSSEFGVELDSLSDLVSFGAAPSFLVYKFGLESFGIVGILISSLLLIGSGLRLARFNVQLVGFSKEYFSGLPTPAQAMTVASFVIWNAAERIFNYELSNQILVGITIVLALVMVSTIRYETLPKPKLEEFKKHPITFSLFVIGFLGMIAFQAKGFFIVMSTYIIIGAILSVYYFFSEENPHHQSKLIGPKHIDESSLISEPDTK